MDAPVGSPLEGFRLEPASGTVKVNQVIDLTVMNCVKKSSDDDLIAPLRIPAPKLECKPFTLSPLINLVAVNGIPFGNATVGIVHRNNAVLRYFAPAKIPPQNPVAVSAQIRSRQMVVSNITVEDDCASGGSPEACAWKGIVHYTAATDVQGHTAAFKMDSAVTFTRDKAGEFRPQGTVKFSIEIPDCVVTLHPELTTIGSSDGILIFDRSPVPTFYSGSGITNWLAVATFDCPDGTQTVPVFPAGGQWLYIPAHQYELPASGNTIAGTVTTGALTWDWNFGRR